jgi:hypothetical protein
LELSDLKSKQLEKCHVEIILSSLRQKKTTNNKISYIYTSNAIPNKLGVLKIASAKCHEQSLHLDFTLTLDCLLPSFFIILYDSVSVRIFAASIRQDKS